MAASSSAVKNGESLAMNELYNLAGMQNRRYRYALPFNAVLGAVGSGTEQTTLSLTIASEGDFRSKFLTMKLSAATVRAGLYMQIRETGYGKQLFRDFVDTVLLASPGFSTSFYPPVEFDQLFLSNSTIQIDLKNTTAEAITISGAFQGWQFIGSAKNLIAGYGA